MTDSRERSADSVVQRVRSMSEHEAAKLVERMQQPVLDQYRDDYVQGRMTIEEYEARVERVLNGFINEPTEQDRALAAIFLGIRSRRGAV